jgi:hypothetical protein
MDSPSTVSFFLPGEAELARLAELDPDADPIEFQTAERAWTLQTYLRLRRAGLPVELTEAVPSRGVLVFHAKHKHLVQRQRRHSRHALLVALRGDRKPVLTADFEILQNGCQSDGVRCFDVPHWPQPGLVARDPGRGDRLRVVAYKGFAENLDPAFRDGRWQTVLSALDLEWRCDAAPFDRNGFRHYPVDWSSFQEVDAVVAVRPADRQLHAGKPASKLINAWLAGVPAILGPEQACRGLRRGELDYFEVSSVDEAGSALRRLRDEPGLLRAMVENGHARAAEFRCDRLVEVWSRLLLDELPRIAAMRRLGRRRGSLVGLTVRSWIRRIGTPRPG